MCRSLSWNSNTGRLFWLWHKTRDQHKFAFKLIEFTDETAICKLQRCPHAPILNGKHFDAGPGGRACGIFQEAFMDSNSTSSPWVSSSQKRYHQKMRSCVSSFLLLPVLVGSHKHMYSRWWKKEIKQRFQPDRLLPLSAVRAGFAVSVGLPAHLRLLWLQLQSTVIFILKCSSPGEDTDWGYPTWDHSLKRGSGAGPGPNCLCHTKVVSALILSFNYDIKKNPFIAYPAGKKKETIAWHFLIRYFSHFSKRQCPSVLASAQCSSKFS